MLECPKRKTNLIRTKIETMPTNTTQYKGRTPKDQKQGRSDNIGAWGWMIVEAIPKMEHRQPTGEQNLASLT